MKNFLTIFLSLLFICLFIAAIYGYTKYQEMIKTTTISSQIAKTFIETNNFEYEVVLSQDSNPSLPTMIGTNSIKTSMDEQTISSMINLWYETTSYAPLKNSTVTIDPEGKIQYKGTLDIIRTIKYFEMTGVDKEIITYVDQYLAPFGTEVPLSASGYFNIKNNQPSISFSSFSLFALPIPIDTVNTYTPNISSFIQERVFTKPEYKINEMKVKNSQLYVDAVLPKKVVYSK